MTMAMHVGSRAPHGGVFVAFAITNFGGFLLAILAGAVVVIAPNFMSDVLGYPADFPNYLKIAWFSAAMGVIAGALGSSFDSSTDVRSITHGQRERQRRIEAGRTGDRHTEAAGGGEQASRA